VYAQKYAVMIFTAESHLIRRVYVYTGTIFIVLLNVRLYSWLVDSWMLLLNLLVGIESNNNLVYRNIFRGDAGNAQEF
jgi:hypothetical protein